jgi:aspartate/methionine/tyrosine aminotransferase
MSSTETTLPKHWISDRSRSFDSSGIRKVFDLAAKLKNPVNFSIGQPDFDVPEPVKQACVEAIAQGKNAYSPSQGLPALRERLKQHCDQRYGQTDRDVFISSGTSGGLVLTMLSLVNPGDEVIIFDPYFVMYPPLVKLAGGVPVFIDSYPDFRIDVAAVEAAITPRTKLVLFNSPANPTGVTSDAEEVRALAELCARHNIVLVSDEIYSQFSYDGEMPTPADINPQTLVIDGFSKSHAMTGWRVGWVHGPSEIIQTMIKLQQFSFVCAPQPAQWAGLAALDVDMAGYRANYAKKRDRLVAGLEDLFEFTRPNGAFYLFPKAPWGTGTEFVTEAIKHEILMIPGSIFSRQDTHFRISYAVPDEILERGIQLLRSLAKGI